MGFQARRTTLFVTPAVSGDVILTLTGIVTACFLGALAPTTNNTLSGSVAIISTYSPLSPTKLLTGITVSASQGAPVTTPTYTLVGRVATASLGYVSAPSANAQAVCDAFRVQMMNGQHAFGPSVIRNSTAADTFKVALYYTTATRNEMDTIYTSAGEVVGTNYNAGGVVLANTVSPTNTAGIAYWTPSTEAVFTNINIPAAFDCMVLYNNTSVTKLAIAVFVFGPQVVTTGDFTLQFATNNSTTGLIRLT